MDLGLTNATAAVVGGGRGMGLAAARCLADDGARIAIVARARTDLDRATEDLTNRGSPDALGVVADIRDADQVNSVFAELGERWNGELNVLINTVGPGAPGSFEDLTDEQWREAFDDGVMGMVRCVRSALPLLRKAAWARIVNFSAHSTQRQIVMLPAYTAAKAALTSVSKNLSLLLAEDEILVNVVSPGSIASESLVGWATSVGVDGSDRRALRASRSSAAGGSAGRNGFGDGIFGVAAQLVHDRSERQCRWWLGLHLAGGAHPNFGCSRGVEGAVVTVAECSTDRYTVCVQAARECRLSSGEDGR